MNQIILESMKLMNDNTNSVGWDELIDNASCSEAKSRIVCEKFIAGIKREQAIAEIDKYFKETGEDKQAYLNAIEGEK